MLEGLTGRVYSNRRLTTPEVLVAVNEPVTVKIAMNVVTGVDSSPWSRGEGIFDDTFTFALSGPVFNVPVGVNVNSERSIIVDNEYRAGVTVPAKNTTWGTIKELYR